jgi:hypothetical protein
MHHSDTNDTRGSRRRGSAPFDLFDAALVASMLTGLALCAALWMS